MPRVGTKVELTKINVNIHTGLYDRIKHLSDITGQSYSSVIQTSIAIGVGQLEPSMLGSIQKTTEANTEALELLGSFTEVFKGMAEGIKFEQQELDLDNE